jgi:hypothetical protein
LYSDRDGQRLLYIFELRASSNAVVNDGPNQIKVLSHKGVVTGLLNSAECSEQRGWTLSRGHREQGGIIQGHPKKPGGFGWFVIRSADLATGVADARSAGIFDVEARRRELSAEGDALERLNAVVDFTLFRADLERAVPRSDRLKGGRPTFDHVLMFKVLILQARHGLSDEGTQYLIRDRLSFMRFLGLGLADTVPDANTIWTFREALTRAKLRGKPAIEVLFKRFDRTRGGWVSGDGRPDHRCHDRRRAEAAQHRR